jgi:hypothetical protein
MKQKRSKKRHGPGAPPGSRNAAKKTALVKRRISIALTTTDRAFVEAWSSEFDSRRGVVAGIENMIRMLSFDLEQYVFRVDDGGWEWGIPDPDDPRGYLHENVDTFSSRESALANISAWRLREMLKSWSPQWQNQNPG